MVTRRKFSTSQATSEATLAVPFYQIPGEFEAFASLYDTKYKGADMFILPLGYK